MSNELKLIDGWSEVPFEKHAACIGENASFKAFPDYEYRVIRRKKEEPMPMIMIGDGLELDTICCCVVIGRERGGYNVATSSGRKFLIVDSNVLEIYRDGKEIWRRK